MTAQEKQNWIDYSRRQLADAKQMRFQLIVQSASQAKIDFALRFYLMNIRIARKAARGLHTWGSYALDKGEIIFTPPAHVQENMRRMAIDPDYIPQAIPGYDESTYYAGVR